MSILSPALSALFFGSIPSICDMVPPVIAHSLEEGAFPSWDHPFYNALLASSSAQSKPLWLNLTQWCGDKHKDNRLLPLLNFSRLPDALTSSGMEPIDAGRNFLLHKSIDQSVIRVNKIGNPNLTLPSMEDFPTFPFMLLNPVCESSVASSIHAAPASSDHQWAPSPHPSAF